MQDIPMLKKTYLGHHLTLLAIGSLAAWSTLVPQASALTIIRNRNNEFAPPSNAVGGGNLDDIFNAAADWWELAIQDSHTVEILYGWNPLNSAGFTTVQVQGGNPNRFLEAQIAFDNDGSSRFFLDPTPRDNREYQTFSRTETNLGGGRINTERLYTNPVGDAVGQIDLFSVALHEIGHALGFLTENPLFPNGGLVTPLEITSPRPLPGTQIPTTRQGGGHFPNSLGSAAMSRSTGFGRREILSAVDILAIAEVSQFQALDLNPYCPTGFDLVESPVNLALGCLPNNLRARGFQFGAEPNEPDLLELIIDGTLLSNDGVRNSVDLQVFPDIFQPTSLAFVELVAIRPSLSTLHLLDLPTDINGFFELDAPTLAVELDSLFPGFRAGQLEFDAVRLRGDLLTEATQSVSEPSTPFGLLALGSLATGSIFLRKKLKH